MSDFQKPLVEQGSNAIKLLFNEARIVGLNPPAKTSVLFIDEIDIACSRTRESSVTSAYEKLTELLHQMDGFSKREDILLMVIAATNATNRLDLVLLRPGRFDRIIQLELPSDDSRKAILIFYPSKTIYDTKSVNFDELVKLTKSFSPAELKNLVNEAAISAVRHNAQYISMKNYRLALHSIKKRKQASMQNLVQKQIIEDYFDLKKYII